MTMLAAVQATVRGAMARFEVITGPERRRRWSTDQKRADCCREFCAGRCRFRGGAPGGGSPGQIYRWRQELRTAAGLAQVLIAPAENPEPKGVPPCAAPAIKVELGRARVRIPGSVPADLTAAVLRALSRR